MSEGILRAGLHVLGGITLATGIFIAVAPGTFFDEIGQYGVRNDHYLGDVAAFYLAAGAGFLIAARRPSWRVPMLVLGAVWYGLHAFNHLFDIGEAESDARGIADTVLLALGAAAFAYLARGAARLGSGAGREPRSRS
jgi:hypothetical protein